MTTPTVYAEMDLLRFTTAGSVDDGKSTLIGRLLYDTKSIFEDQMEQIEGASRRLGESEVNLALITDGLRAEREQKITIDVAYRYFATPRRKFIIADTPGHVQYTRNMVTGASNAELAIVLVDARNGVVTQSKRHAFIASLLGIPHLIVAVNKMDLVDYAEVAYEKVRHDFTEFSRKLTVQDITFIPISALRGDNVVEWSDRMPWYKGGSLLHRLETVNVGSRRNHIDFRFPVQYVLRPNQGFRGYAGTVASGSVAPGEEIVILPSRRHSRIRSVETYDGAVGEARTGDAVVLTIEDEVDISRGDMIVRRKNVPIVGDRFEAYLCWMSETPLELNGPYMLLHTTNRMQAFVERIEYRVDVDTLHRQAANSLELNEIGRVEITTSKPLFFDSYRVNVRTGSFVLVDLHSNVTVAAGMIRGEPTRDEDVTERPVSKDVVWEGWNVPREEREIRTGHRAAILWFTGLPGAGKTTIAREVERRLFERGVRTMLLDGDQLRHGLSGDLGFTPGDRVENIRRVGEVAKLFFEQGSVVLCAFVSPYVKGREAVGALVPEGRFLEIHVHAPAEELRRRDPKGLYRREERGEVAPLTGVSAPYESPRSPALDLDTGSVGVEEAVAAVLKLLEGKGIVG
ncbi:MAG: sulfate adenylyltransferase subunit CysN [Gemmatimonadetes bacterium]|nr:sulfate adenylyltransferase subunit CysN [Gemmatimonadota bacterium]